MSGHKKLTDDQIRLVRQAMAKRRDLQRQLDNLPTLEDMAEELRVSKRWLSEIVNGRARVSYSVECTVGVFPPICLTLSST
jgi:transcriptional regulator with XRE-family HTH domain